MIELAKHHLAAAVLVLALGACATNANPTPQGQQSFDTPETAVSALIDANRRDDTAAITAILGPQADKLVNSGDPVADAEGRQRFVAAYDQAHSIDSDGNGKDTLIIGNEGWPMPIPIVQGSDGWYFDTAAGQDEILDRRIGRNELDVLNVCRNYVQAQREFAAMHQFGGHGKPVYAQRIVSSPHKHDGLYWPADKNFGESPLGPLMASAQAEGYETIHGQRYPYHGYYYRILKRQGPAAAGGERDYIDDNGQMTGGFALIATPATYGDSGIMTFIVNQNGFVYQKNLGDQTAAEAAKIDSYDPDASWQIVP